MDFPKNLTVYQTTAIVINAVLGVGLLPLPLIAVRAGDTGAPMVTFLAILVTLFGLAVLTMLGMRFPEQSIIHYSEDIIGKWLGRIGSLFIIAFFITLTSLVAREFGEVVITNILPETPLEITVIVMLVLASIFSRNDMMTFAYIHVFYLPILFVPSIAIIALSLGDADPLYLQPLWGHDASGMVTGVFTIAALLQGSFIITMIIPFMRAPEKAMKATIWSIAAAGGLYVLIVINTLALFGPEEIKNLLWPTLELARTATIPGEFVERLDIFFLVVFVTAVFTTMYATYMFTIYAIKQLFRLRDHKMFSFFILPFVFVIAMLPQNTIQMYEIIERIGRAGLVLTIIYPVLLYVIARLRKKQGRRSQ
ncbi:endospore germination permease [Salicibibacter cibarius]|uniref:Endospore germination permease n=1 Tax=Salicibibacter cibarius TaxID=2743000 RepID=A0A7T7CDF8_9BACI|nr:endospore germination permease [Salicibibacter cibarius]QQK77958.1 endospore germination permease [Salicibibacter cibarius]